MSWPWTAKYWRSAPEKAGNESLLKNSETLSEKVDVYCDSINPEINTKKLIRPIAVRIHQT